MKVMVCFREYRDIHENKDPGLIVMGLQELGAEAIMLTTPKHELSDYQAPFPLVATELSNWVRTIKEIRPDCVIIYHALGRDFTQLLTALHTVGIPVIIKADSDGNLSPYPYFKEFTNRYFRQSFTEGMKAVAKIIIPWYADQWLLANFKKTRGMIVESPLAKERTLKVLAMKTKANFAAEIYVIPDPVSPLFTQGQIEIQRNNQIVSVGRWDDTAPKNPRVLLKAITRALEVRADYTAIVVGSGESNIRMWTNLLSQNIKERIHVVGPLRPDKIKLLLTHSKIFLSSSRWESFGIAAAEALCSGCTLVGPDLPSFRYLMAEGLTGTLGENSTYVALYRALTREIDLWDQGARDPMAVATRWRIALEYRTVAKSIIEKVNICAL